MRKIKDLLRLRLLGGVSSRRQLARAVGCSKTAVSDCLRRAEVAGLSTWDAIAELDEVELEKRLYPSAREGSAPPKTVRRPLPDWSRVREELARRDHQVTLALLWQEYKSEHPEGYQYSQFAELYRRFEKKLSVVLRQTHRPGEKVFVDFCDGLSLTDPHTGEIIPTQLFVGALGASSYTFALATLSQELPVWLDCHVRMFEFLSGVSSLTICDNLLSGVTHADRYEAELNPSYRELATHYGTCVIPTRVRKPRDKGKVEAAVLVAQRWILAVLRHRRFYHLDDLNAAIAELLTRLNGRVMRHVRQSRQELYERLDRPALKPLPARPYEFAEWAQVGVNIDYHVSFDDHYYRWHGRPVLSKQCVKIVNSANVYLEVLMLHKSPLPVIGMDIAKNVFQLHTVNPETGELERRKLKRAKVAEFFANRAPSIVAMEACGGAHHWARMLLGMGHRVKLLPANHVRAFVTRDKTDALDAQAIYVASQQSHIREVPVKSLQQQACLSLHRIRAQLMKVRIMQTNAVRGLLYEFGLVLPEGHKRLLSCIQSELARAQLELGVPDELVLSLQEQLRRIDTLQKDIDALDARLASLVKQNHQMQAAVAIPGIGALTATAVLSAVPDLSMFDSARQFAAWLGLTPRQVGTGGRTQQLGISKRGDSYLRYLLISGARSVAIRSTRTK